MAPNSFQHPFEFDPTYGYGLEELLQVSRPEVPADFEDQWRARYQRALAVDPKPHLRQLGSVGDRLVWELSYTSTDGILLGGWLTAPQSGNIRRGLVVGHGYGGREGPDFHLPVERAVMLFPCCRGISRSPAPPISPDPWWHVLHDIDKPDRYILGGCAEDIWVSVSVMLQLYPELNTHVGYLGASFGGGVGAMALAFEERVARGHLSVPSFGNQPLRLTLPTIGSGASVREFYRQHGDVVLETLKYYDAAVSASFIEIPMHCACALFDPAVAPPGQFAVYNALAGPKKLFTLEAGHFDYPNSWDQERSLLLSLQTFFADL